MEIALVASAALLGLAGAPHCAAMCSAPCAAAVGPRGGATGGVAAFHAARVAGYALGGAAASASVGVLATWSEMSPALRPLWTLLHAAALALGLFLLVQGRQPALMARWGRAPQPATSGGWQRMQGPVRAAATGGLWVAWPCGLLQSALLVAAMTSHPVGGAAAMAAFAIASAPGLVLGPWAFRRLMRGGDQVAQERLALRMGGALLVASAAFALGHGLWARVAAFCAGL